MISILKILGISVLLLSCSNSSEYVADGELVTLDIAEASNGKNLFNHVSEIEPVFLEYKGSESLVASINKLICRGDYIYILNYYKPTDYSLMIFTKGGEFLKNIREIDVQETVNLGVKDFSLNTDGRIVLLSYNNKLVYLNENFDVEKIISLPFEASNIYIDANNRKLFYTNRMAINHQADSLMYELIWLDEADQLVNKFHPFSLPEYSEIQESYMHGHTMPSKNGFLFTRFLNDTIWEVSAEDIQARYEVDFGSLGVENEVLDNVILRPFDPILTSDFVWGLSYPLEYKDYLFFSYFERNLPMGLFFQKSNGKMLKFSAFDLIDESYIAPWPKYTDGDYLYGYFQEGDFALFERLESFPDESIVKIASQYISKYYNPVIIKYQIK